MTPSELHEVYALKDVAQYIAPCLAESGSPSMANTLNIDSQLADIQNVKDSLNSFLSTNNGNLSTNDFNGLNELETVVKSIIAEPSKAIKTSEYPTVNSANSWETVTSEIVNQASSECSQTIELRGDKINTGCAGGSVCIDVFNYSSANINGVSCPNTDASILRLQKTL